jgi:hypothetical protein
VTTSARATGRGQPGSAAAAARAGDRRPWWIWVTPFAALLAVLVIPNRSLFTRKIYERGDSAANSILIQQAMHATLLVGNYSRQGFNHPGPAYMYVQALGQWIFYYLLHVVPTAWNAHVLALYALNSALAAAAVAIVYGWTRSVRAAAVCLAVFLVFAIVNPPVVNSDWNPYVYVLTCCVFVVAAGSVAAGHVHDAWILALTGWFLIHGQACFLFFVPVIGGAVLVILIWSRRRTLAASLRGFARDRRAVWIPVLAISALFALPIVVNLVLHWPGDFGKYFAYGNSSRAGGHSVAQVIRFALWFWWPQGHAWVVAALLYGLALAVTFGLASGPLRRFLGMLLLISAVSSAALCVYAAVGIDFLNEYYIGYFYWSAPVVTTLVIAVGAVQEMNARAATAVAAAAAVAGCAVAVTLAGMRTSLQRTQPGLPAAVARLAALAGGRTIVLTIAQTSWGDATAFLVQAERTHVRACVGQPSWTFMMTRQFICTPQQAADGAHYALLALRPPPAVPVIFRFGGSNVAAERQ